MMFPHKKMLFLQCSLQFFYICEVSIDIHALVFRKLVCDCVYRLHLILYKWVGNIIMHQIFPKVNQVFAYHLKNFDVINSLMDSVNLRVDAEEQYERAINKSANKISELQSEHPLYSKIIFSFKSLINQRAHQIRHFKKEIAKEAQTLKNALAPIEQFMKSHLSELKSMQKQMKQSFDTLTKSKATVQQKMKELDQKFVLNQISILYKQNIGLRKNSQSYINEQENILKGLEKDWENLRVGVMNFQTGALQRQKRIWQLDVKVEEEFVDFFKKLNVHEISLIRNIQYDIDTMIKKTDIFNWQNKTEFNNQFSIKTIDQLQQSFLDPYRGFKQAIISQDEIMDPKLQNQADATKLQILKQKLSNSKECEEMLGEIRKDYVQYRDQVCEWIQSFRKNGNFKFQPEQFQLLVHVFREFLKCAIVSLDFQCVQKTIVYGNSYFSTVNNRKRTVLDQIKNEKLLSDLSFWRFYLLWTIRQTISSCKNKQQREIHLRNGVYTTLLSNSLAMVEWGLEKHSIKNLIGKLAKTYASLTEVQVAQLLKVIQAAYQNLEKAKKGKKE